MYTRQDFNSAAIGMRGARDNANTWFNAFRKSRDMNDWHNGMRWANQAFYWAAELKKIGSELCH